MIATTERMTTVKVSTKVRDQINTLAAERGLTANSLIEQVLDEMLWRHKVELAGRQMRATSAAEMVDYLAEVASMDASLADGLEDEDWSAEWSN